MGIRFVRKPQGVARSFDRSDSQRLVFPLGYRLYTSPAFPLYPPYTFSAWIKPLNASSEQGVFFMGHTDTSDNHWMMGLDTGKGMLDAYWDTHDRIYTVNSYITNEWTHIAARIISNTERYMYLNGDTTNKASGILSRPTTMGSAPAIALGRRHDSSPGDAYDGLIAHVSVFGDAVHENDIVLLSQGISPFRINTSEVVWYYEGTDFSDQELLYGDYGVPGGTADLPTWGVGRAPLIFAVPTVPFWAQGELLPIDLYPDAATVSAIGVDPEIGFGAININPIEVSAATASVIGGVDESDVDLTPSPAEVVTSKSGPQVVQNSLAISSSAAAANASKTDPDVEQSSINVDPDSATAVSESIDPQVYFTGIEVTPPPAVVSCSGVDPAVDDAQDIITTPSSAATSTVDPSLFFSSQSATPAPASAATLAFIDLEYTPSAASAGTDTSLLTIIIGESIISLYPVAVTAGTDVVDPTLFFSSFGQTPDPVSAGTDSVDPTYYVYGGGYPVVYTSPAVTIPVVIPPTTHQGSINLYPDVVEATTESIEPTLFWTSTSAAPDPAVSVADVVAPIAGAFFRYFMEADVSLGGWTNELDSSEDIYTSIDEDPPDDDDYIQSDWGAEQEIYKGKLERMSEPDDDTLHYVEYRYQKENDLTRVDMIVRLRQGESVITGWSHDDVGLDVVTQRQVLSEEEAALITDYQDLHLEFEAWERY